MSVFSSDIYEFTGSSWSYKVSDGSSFSIVIPPIAYYLGVQNYRSLNSNPNWKTDIAKRRDASRAYRTTGLKTHIPVRTRFDYTISYVPYQQTVGHYEGGSPWSLVGLLPYDEALRDIALSRLKRKLASQTKEMQGIVPLVEIRELRELIRYLVGQTTHFAVGLLAIMKDPLNWWAYRKLGKTVFDFKVWEAWLAYSFAIKPTLSDIDSAVEAIKNYLGDPPRSVVLRGTASKEWTTSTKFYTGFTGVSFGIGLENTVKYAHSLIYTYTGGFDINLLSSNTYNPPGELYNFPAALNQFGLTPEKLPGSVWELIPFSWLLDYFGTIGAFLDDAFESSSGSTRYCTLSRKYSVMIDRSAKVYSSYSSLRVPYERTVGGLYDYYDFERTVYQNLPHRSLRFKTVDEVGSNGVNRLLNLLAVLAGSAKRPMRG
jgi:hypothetical protein